MTLTGIFPIIIFICIIFFVGLFVWILKMPRKSVFRNKLIFVIVFSSFFVIILAMWLIPIITARNYISVDAVITNTEEYYRSRSASSSKDVDYDVTFQYTYNNSEYFGHIIYLYKGQIPDTHTKVRCNPDNPTELAAYTSIWVILASVVFGIISYSLLKDFIRYLKYRNKDDENFTNEQFEELG